MALGAISSNFGFKGLFTSLGCGRSFAVSGLPGGLLLAKLGKSSREESTFSWIGIVWLCWVLDPGDSLILTCVWLGVLK